MKWHNDDHFWESYGPLLFNEKRWALAEEETQALIRLLSLTPGMAVLDSCCGVGRHSVELAKHGLAVTGIDITASFLEAARETASAEGLNAEFLRSDIREFRRPLSFDAIINMFTSFGYFEDETDDAKVLKNIFESLKPGGKILIQLLGKEVLARDFKEDEWFEENGVLVLTEYAVLEDWEKLQNRWIVIENGKKTDYTFSHRIYSARDMKLLLRFSGFENIRIYGNLEGAPYDHRAEQLVCVAEKKVP